MVYWDNVYGREEIKDPLVLKIIKTPAFLRLQKIHNAGATSLVDHRRRVTRFEHCLGVYFLLDRLGASREEQLAGLLHDLPHTAFSHTIDFLYESAAQDFHEKFHEKILRSSGIYGLLKKSGLHVERFLNAENFSLLEQPIPHLCADRVDYFLRDSLEVATLSKVEMETIVNDLVVIGGRIAFRSREPALLVARKFIDQNRNYWASPREALWFAALAKALGLALSAGILSRKDLFTDDETLLKKLRLSRNVKISQLLRLLRKGLEFWINRRKPQFKALVKLRYLDPLILDQGKLARLSQLDHKFKLEMESYARGFESRLFLQVVDEKLDF